MEIKKIFDVWPHIYLFDLFRYLIPASIFFLLFWVIGKNRWKHLFIQSSFPKSKQMWKEFGYSMSTVVIFSLIGVCVYTAEKAGLTKIYYKISDYGNGYLVLSLCIMLVFHDFYFYWTHRWMHHKRIFKYVHRVHHESTNPSPWAAYSFHPWEAVVQALVLPIMVFTIPLYPLVIFLFLTYMIIRNVMGHLGFEILPKGFTQNKCTNWNTAVTHHNMHHEHFHCNYGLYFSWWDRWMKTEHTKYHQTFEDVKSRPKVSVPETKRVQSGSTLILLLLTATMIHGQSVEGKWTTYNEETGSLLSVIEITKNGNSIEGKITQIFLEPFQGEDPICSKCSGERKNKKVIDLNFLWGFSRSGNSLTDGKILDPQNGEVYQSKMWLEDENTLKVRGYGGVMNLFYRTQTWKRESDSKEKTFTGAWLTIDDHSGRAKSRIEIVETNGELKGFVRKIFPLPHEGPNPVCTQCKGELKNARIVGMKILYGFKKKEDKWDNGKILDPANGNVYTSAVWLVDEKTLKVRGYLGPFFRSQIWKRL